jgi:cytochrome c oxidase assembly protein subunit 15
VRADSIGTTMQINADPAGQRERTLRRVAALAFLLMVSVALLSAFMRHRGNGLACEPWPACYGQAAPAADTAVALARVAHRIAASAVLVLAILLVTGHWRSRDERLPAVALLLTALALAALGVVTPGSTHWSVTTGNLVGGFVMIGLSARLGTAPSALTRLAAPAWLAAAAMLAQAAMGAALSAGFVMRECRAVIDCGAPAVAHAAGAVLVVASLPPLLVRLWRGGARAEPISVVSLVLLQSLLGWALSDHPGLLVLLHNMIAVLLLAVVTRRA